MTSGEFAVRESTFGAVAGDVGGPGGLRRALDDSTVALAVMLVDRTGVVEQVAQWVEQERQRPGGRPETFSKRTLLVALVICAITDQPLELTQVTDVLFRQLSPRWRGDLGIPDAPTDAQAWEAAYRCVRTRFHALLKVIDPSWLPKNRRLDPATFESKC